MKVGVLFILAIALVIAKADEEVASLVGENQQEIVGGFDDSAILNEVVHPVASTEEAVTLAPVAAVIENSVIHEAQIEESSPSFKRPSAAIIQAALHHINYIQATTGASREGAKIGLDEKENNKARSAYFSSTIAMIQSAGLAFIQANQLLGNDPLPAPSLKVTDLTIYGEQMEPDCRPHYVLGLFDRFDRLIEEANMVLKSVKRDTNQVKCKRIIHEFDLLTKEFVDRQQQLVDEIASCPEYVAPPSAPTPNQGGGLLGALANWMMPQAQPQPKVETVEEVVIPGLPAITPWEQSIEAVRIFLFGANYAWNIVRFEALDAITTGVEKEITRTHYHNAVIAAEMANTMIKNLVESLKYYVDVYIKYGEKSAMDLQVGEAEELARERGGRRPTSQSSPAAILEDVQPVILPRPVKVDPVTSRVQTVLTQGESLLETVGLSLNELRELDPQSAASQWVQKYLADISQVLSHTVEALTSALLSGRNGEDLPEGFDIRPAAKLQTPLFYQEF